jgi:putative FmdB family regulatory protein
MPIYEYECTKCGAKFELRRSIADNDDEIRCPRCGAEQPRRVFSVFGTASSSSTCAPSGST